MSPKNTIVKNSLAPRARRLSLYRVPTVWVGWVGARIILLLLVKTDFTSRGDVAYYYFGIYGADPTAMTEYPAVGVWPVNVLAWITGEHLDQFYIAFMSACLLLDAAFLAALLRGHRLNPRAFLGAWFWVVFGTAAGQVFVMRLDLFPSVAVAAAAAWMFRHPRWASAALALATLMKLWPGVLAAGLVGRYKSARSWLRLAVFFATGIALCVFTVFTHGFDRLISPLTYQGERGLQIESVAATWYMYQAYLSPANWEVGYAPSRSFEIAGPGTATAAEISTWAMVATVVFAFCWALVRFIRGGWTPRTTVAFFTLMIVLLIVCNKVFSPQYIIWVGPLLAVALRQPLPLQFAPADASLAATPPPTRWLSLRWVLGLLALFTIVAAGLGTFVYPFHYDYLWKLLGQQAAPLYALIARNILMLAITLLTAVWLVLEMRNKSALIRAQERLLAAEQAAPVAL